MQINKLRLEACSREQKFVDVPNAERLSENKVKKYVEVFTDQLVHRQKKIHLLLTNMFIQELKLIHLFQLPKYNLVVTSSLLSPGHQKSLPTLYNAKHKVEARDILKYLKSLGLKANWDEVEFLIRRFLYESPFFRVPNPLRWDWKDYQETGSTETHCESVNLNSGRQTHLIVREYSLLIRQTKGRRRTPGSRESRWLSITDTTLTKRNKQKALRSMFQVRKSLPVESVKRVKPQNLTN